MKKTIYLAGIISLVTGVMPAFAADTDSTTIPGQIEQQAVADTDENALPGDDVLAFAPGGAMAACPAGKHMSFTDEQLEKLNSLKNQMADAVGPKRLELSTQMRQLKDLITQPSVDRSKITSIQGKINSLRDQICDLKLNYRLDTLAVLTDEQKKELRHHYLIRNVMGGHKRHGGWGHHGFGGPGGPGGPSGHHHHHHFDGNEKSEAPPATDS